MSTQEEEEPTWLGTSLADICRGQGPWAFSTSPVAPSKYHAVLYETPVPPSSPPEPHYNADPKHWDDDHVRMPYSAQSLFVGKNEEGEEIVRPRWDVITEALLSPISSSEALEKAILKYNGNLPRFEALHHFFNEVLEEEESEFFFTEILPAIVKLALRLPEIVPGSLPLLRKNHSRSVSLSQLQIASLLANAFLCTYVWRKEWSEDLPGPNFIRLFVAHRRPPRRQCVAEKLKCVCHYFRRVTQMAPIGCVTFERKFVPRSGIPRWDALDSNLGNTKIHVTSTGTIEDCPGLLQADFANRFVGGGVLGYGCVQEEIRFVICPELIIGRLFVEGLGDTEAVAITGIERYSDYSGYGDSFKWEGNVTDETPFDEYRRRKTSVIVIDATRFNRAKDQYHSGAILRELNKAYVGFSCREKGNIAPVATGNWGCGAYKGDPKLKSLIQLMACNATGRDMVYYSFGNTELVKDLYNMHLFLANNQVSIVQLWRHLCSFCASSLPPDQLYSYIQQSHFDSKTQPTLKQFFTFGEKKLQKPEHDTTSSKPSTSRAEKAKPRTPQSKYPKLPITKESREPRSTDLVEEPVTHLSKKIFRISDHVRSLPKAKTAEAKKAPVTPDDVISAIERINGPTVKSSEGGETESQASLLEEIDRLRTVSTPSFGDASTKMSDDFVMDIDVDMDVVESDRTVVRTEEVKVEVKSRKEEKKTKITDYFARAS